VRLEGLGKLKKNPMTSSAIETATFLFEIVQYKNKCSGTSIYRGLLCRGFEYAGAVIMSSNTNI
jgi:hypothetical protein